MLKCEIKAVHAKCKVGINFFHSPESSHLELKDLINFASATFATS